MSFILLLLAIALIIRYVLPDRQRQAVRRALGSAFLFGAIGFAAGFLGPIIFAPGANQGPLLGIFITGPLGFVIGLVRGVFQNWRGRTSDEPAS